MAMIGASLIHNPFWYRFILIMAMHTSFDESGEILRFFLSFIYWTTSPNVRRVRFVNESPPIPTYTQHDSIGFSQTVTKLPFWTVSRYRCLTAFSHRHSVSRRQCPLAQTWNKFNLNKLSLGIKRIRFRLIALFRCRAFCCKLHISHMIPCMYCIAVSKTDPVQEARYRHPSSSATQCQFNYVCIRRCERSNEPSTTQPNHCMPTNN